MRFFSMIFLFFAGTTVFAQEIANYTQFFVNPYTVNPAFAGIEGRTGLYLTYRQQWVDFNGAPTLANASAHFGLTRGLGIGVNLNNDKRGVLNTSSGLVSLSYAARLGNSSYLRFGASAGAASNGLDLDNINTNDPAFANALAQNTFLIGNVGLSLHLKSFHFGASMPDLFEPQLVSDVNFGLGDIKPAERLIFSASNRFYFGNDNHVFEPYLLYRIRKDLPSQFEAAGIVHLNHTVWFGGTYKQDFGISATAGFKIPTSFGVGYSYTFKSLGVNQLLSPTHEVTFSLLVGKKHPRRQKYSFVNTLIENEPPPIPSAPSGETPQTFCAIDLPTIGQLRATGANIKWYDRDKAGTLLRNTQELVDGVTYYATQTVNNVESEDRFAVTVSIVSVAAPTADQIQNFKQEDNPTVGDIVGSNDKMIWYTSEDGGSALNPDRGLIDGTTYYASQVLEGCESIDRFPVQVNVEEPEAVVDTATVTPDPVVTTPPDTSQYAQDGNIIQQQTSDDTIVVKRGQHLLELPLGQYVIVGVFGSYDNAEKYSDKVFLMGYHETKFGFLTEKKLWYVLVKRSEDPVAIRELRDELRKKYIFRDAWVLEVRE